MTNTENEMITICFLDEYSLNSTDLSGIRGLGDYRGYEDTLPEQVLQRSAGADVIITNKVRITEETMRGLPQLKLICVAATGMNNVDLDAAARLGIAVKNAVDYSTDSVAEATFAGVLALLRQTVYFDTFVKSGAYARSPRLFHFGRTISLVHGKRWGIVGMGNIGRRVAQIATVFGAQVVHHSVTGSTDPTYPQLTLDELLRTCDILSIHAPLTPLTENLLDYPQLALMKPTAVVANLARGKIINEAGLARALNEGRIAGAVTDVYSREPITADNPLYSVTDPYKLILSSHNAWASEESIGRLAECIANNIREFFSLD